MTTQVKITQNSAAGTTMVEVDGSQAYFGPEIDPGPLTAVITHLGGEVTVVYK